MTCISDNLYLHKKSLFCSLKYSPPPPIVKLTLTKTIIQAVKSNRLFKKNYCSVLSINVTCKQISVRKIKVLNIIIKVMNNYY